MEQFKNNKFDISNPVINAILNDNKKLNPNYNPKTKKGRLQPKYIETAPPTDFRGGFAYGHYESTKNMKFDNEDLGLTPDEIDEYAESGVIANPYISLEDLNRIRAEKQSALEQFGNAVTQAVVNELVIGTFKGISDLIDAGLNAAGLVDDDYTNWFSSIMEDAQDSIRKNFAIYQKDPNASWAVGDFGWWMNNAVSIASTASILLPVAGAGRALALAGKFTKLSKLGRSLSFGMAKMAKGAGLTNSPGRLALSMNRGAKITRDAFLSRTVENYQEAREVYKETYEDAKNRFSKMSEAEKQQVRKLNPELQGLSDEEAAKKIASMSADETFNNDYAMLAMDIVQYKALAGMWKGTTKTNVSAGVRGFNKRVADNIGKTGEAAGKDLNKITFGDRWRGFKESPLKTTTQGITSIEWSEGVEEGYQNIQTEKGKEVAEKIFNPNFKSKTVGDYLSDASTWEAAFWGVLGGVGFKKIGDGVNYLGEKIEDKWNKHKILGKEINLTNMSVEKAQAAEIAGRQLEFEKLQQDMDLINQGYHPNKVATDEKGNPIRVDGEIQRKELTLEEQEVAKQEVLDNFLTKLTINAAENGTYDLLKDFLDNPNVKKYFEEKGLDNAVTDADFSKYTKRKMDEVYDAYSNAVYDVFNSVDVTNTYLGKLTAKSIAEAKLNISNLNDKRNEVLEKINKNNSENVDYQAYYNQVLEKNINDRLNNLEKQKNIIEQAYAAEAISKQARDLYIKEKDEEINRLEQLIADKHTDYKSITESFTEEEKKLVGNNFTQRFNKFLDKVNIERKKSQTAPAAPKKSLQSLVDVLADIDNSISEWEDATPTTQKQLEEVYDRKAMVLDEYVKNKYTKAAEKVRNWIKKQTDLEQASAQLAKGEVKEIQDELDILKIGHDSTERFINSIEIEIGAEMERRAKEAEAEKTVTVDGKKVSEEEANKIKKEMEKVVPPTGEESTANPTEPTKPEFNPSNPAETSQQQTIETPISTSIEEIFEKIDEDNMSLDLSENEEVYIDDRTGEQLIRTTTAISADKKGTVFGLPDTYHTETYSNPDGSKKTFVAFSNATHTTYYWKEGNIIKSNKLTNDSVKTVEDIVDNATTVKPENMHSDVVKYLNNEKNPWILPSTTLGTGIHNFIEDVLIGYIDEEDLNNLEEDYPNMTNDELVNLYNQAIKLKEKIDKDYEFVGSEITTRGTVPVSHVNPNLNSTLGIAGSIDLLLYNKNTGEFEVWDFKTKRGQITEKDKKKWSLQISVYKKMLEDRFGIKVGKLQIVPISMYDTQTENKKYPEPKGFKDGTAEYTEEDGQLMLNDKPYKSARAVIGKNIEITPSEINIQYERLTPLAQSLVKTVGVSNEVILTKEQLEEAKKELNSAKEQIVETVLSNDDLAASMADTFIRTELIKNNKEEILSLDVNDYNTTKYKELVNKIVDHLIIKGVTPSFAPVAAERALQIVFKSLGSLVGLTKFTKLANQIASNIKVQRDANGKAAAIDILGREELDSLIEQFIEEYAKERGIRRVKDGKTIINAENLVDYVVNKSDLSIEEAKYVLRNIRGFINAQRSKKFIFNNKSIIYGLHNDISGLIDAIQRRRSKPVEISTNTRVSPLSNATARNKAKEAILKRTDQSKISAKRTGHSIEISIDDVPVGYLTSVTNDARGNNIRLNVTEETKKSKAKNSDTATFYYVINTGGNGNLTSNVDELFNALINSENKKDIELFQAISNIEIFNDHKNINIEKDVKTLLNNSIIKKLIADGTLVLPEVRVDYTGKLVDATDTSKALALVKAINNILHYDKYAESSYELEYSFNNWKKSIKQNYEETKKIQEAIDAGRDLDINISHVFEGKLNYDLSGKTKNKTSDIFTLSKDAKWHYNHPIVYATDDLGMVDDNGTEYNSKAGGLTVGDMGILIENKNGKPFIAKVTDTARVNDTVLGQEVNAELIRLFTQFITGHTDPNNRYKRFDDLYEALSDLMGGKAENGNGKGGDHMFYGYQVIKTNNYIGICRPGANNAEGFIAVIHKNRPNSQAAGNGITINDPKFPKGRHSFFTEDKQAINYLANKITAGLKFNRMFFMAKNRSHAQVRNNRYFRKVVNPANGRSYFQVTINRHRVNYESYTQFAHNNGIFYTNQRAPVNGSYFDTSSSSGTIYINSAERVVPQTPVNEQTTNRSLADILNNATEENPANTIELLQATGLSKAKEQILNGGIEGIPKLIPDTVIYNENSELPAYTENGKVYIGKKGVTIMRRGKTNAIRLLVHERLHNLLEETGEFKKANIVRNLLDTYNAAIEAAKQIKKGQPFYKEAQDFLKTANTSLSIENYHNAIAGDEKLLNAWNNSTQEEKESWFAEEWLVESLTQPNLITFLNNVTYGNTKVSDIQNKSIWQKIIETLLKLFNGNKAKIKDFTILAEQFRLLGENNNAENNGSQTAENSSTILTAETQNADDISNNTVVPERNNEQYIKLDDEVSNIDDDIENFDFNSDNMWASAIPFIGEDVDIVNEVLENPTVDPAGIVFVNNIDEYLNNFSKEDRAKIKKLIDDGYIQYACKV